MDLGLKDKVYLVTGGAKGIGEAIIRAIAAEGGIAVIVGRNADDNDAVVRDIRDRGGRADALAVELAQADSCKKTIEFAFSKYARIDGLVNNAGVNDGVGLEQGDPQRFMASLGKNISHYYNLAHYALPRLKAVKGSILNIGSKVSVTGQGGTSGYAASKGAINALTREWAVELLPYGIRVNCIIPAEVWTPQYAKWVKTLPDAEAKLKSIVSRIPLEHRMTTPEEIADMAVFLLSARSAHTTGQIIFVDGGYTHLDRAIG